MAENYIIAKNIWKSYKEHNNLIDALKDVSFTLDKGEILCLIGPNGSGKTTLLKILGGYLKPDRGEVIIDNLVINRLKYDDLMEFRRKYVGFIFQEDISIETLSIYENLELAMIPIERDRGRRRERIIELLKEWDMVSIKDRLYKHLSSGEKRVVAILKALVNNPEIILADEPTSNLDEENTELIIDKIRMLNREGKTVIVATHDIYVQRAFNKILYIRSGEISKP